MKIKGINVPEKYADMVTGFVAMNPEASRRDIESFIDLCDSDNWSPERKARFKECMERQSKILRDQEENRKLIDLAIKAAYSKTFIR